MHDLAWHPVFSEEIEIIGEAAVKDFLGENSREHYIEELVAALDEESSRTIIILGEHGDDRVKLVDAAQKQAARRGDIIHVVGTSYAQHLKYGALAFLLTGLDPSEEIGQPSVMRAISKNTAHSGWQTIVLLQYPQLLDTQSRAVLAQLAYSRSILLVILAEEVEFIPAEFSLLCRGEGHLEFRIEPLTLGEAHRALLEEFAAAPTPVAIASLWQRSQGNPGWLAALAHDALANGKLVIRGGYLILGPGRWPHGGQLESMAFSQAAVLTLSERKILHRLSVKERIFIRDLDPSELSDLDRLIGWGFVRRSSENRGMFESRATLLAAVLRTEGSKKDRRASKDLEADNGSFFAFISGQSADVERLLRSDDSRESELYRLLDSLRKNLLGGRLREAHDNILGILPVYLDELPAVLFDVVVLVRAILDVVSDSADLARPILDSVAAQLEGSDAGYDQWLVHSMRNFIRDADDPARHAPLSFDSKWDVARWWFSELLASRESTKLQDRLENNVPAQPHEQSEILELLVGIRHGYQPRWVAPKVGSEDVSPALLRALELMLDESEREHEGRTMAGLETLIKAGFAIFAVSSSNQVFEDLSVSSQITLTNGLKRRRRANNASKGITRQEFLDYDYPVLEVLTNREKFVATAAAQGLNNQQIAQDAGVSIRTVEGHLYQIYSKLALAGRKDLNTLVASLHLGSSVGK